MKFLANLTLGKKITLLTALGLLLGVGVFSFLGIRAVNQATEAMLQDRLTTAQIVADYLDEALGRAIIELKNTAQMIEIDETIDGLEPRIDALKDTYSRLSIQTHSIYLLNKEGQVIWSKPASSMLIGANISYYPGIVQAIESGESSISGLVSTPLTDDPAIFLISPIKEEQQRSGGVLIVAVNLAQSSIGGFVQPIRLGQTGYVEIVDQNGIVVTRTEPGPKLASFERSDHSGRFAALIAAGKPTRGLCHTCHDPVERVERKDVLAFVPLTEARWGVVIRQSETEALAPIHELRQNLLLFGSGLITVAFLFVAMTTRDIVNRLRILTTASKRIAEGDLSSPVTSAGKDEVSMLAQGLDDMRAKLMTSYGELERRTEELSSLLAISEILTSLRDLSNLDSVLDNALDKTLEIMKTNAGGILLLDGERQLLCYRIHRGLYSWYNKEVCFSLGEGISGKVAQTGETKVVEDILMEHLTGLPDLDNTDGFRALVSIPLRVKGNVLGVINVASQKVRKFSSRDVRLLEGIAGQIATAVENAQLHQEVRRKEEIRGELLQDLFSIQEEERRRIARELHDETSQVLASLNANLEAAVSMLPASADKTKDILRKTQGISINMLDEVHKLIYELRPSLLDDLGLVPAIRWLADNNLKPAGIAVAFKTRGQMRRLGLRLETTLFRVTQEAVYNIVKHANARNAEISLHFKKNAVAIHIRDDGKGFDVEQAINTKDRPRGLGLLGMKERVGLMNGTFVIKSSPGGGGTEINIEIPLGQEGINE